MPIDANLPFTEVTTALFLKNRAEVRLIYDAGMDNRNTGTTDRGGRGQTGMARAVRADRVAMRTAGN
ncbi:hypothetical protein [Fodinicurvata sp. EGI_FJ10296]|uniref:hypothetical protein n=1 Tax=Fodinicurvata sp. EGI_FJ10296 TaxID=3231908 RepID=UPI00345468E0